MPLKDYRVTSLKKRFNCNNPDISQVESIIRLKLNIARLIYYF